MNKEQVYNLISDLYKKKRTHYIKSNIGRTGSYHNAEDVVQEAFVRACQYWNSYEPEMHSVEAWFSRILENSLRSFNQAERRRGMSVEIDEDDLRTFNPNPYFNLVLAEIKSDVAQIKDKDDRFIISLNLFEQYAPRDICKVTDRSIGAINNVLYRFKEQLKVKYGEGLDR